MQADLIADLIGPAVVAAVIAAIVSVIVAVINRATVLGTHRERLNHERDLADHRATQDIALAERKVEADMALAERKVAADITLAERRATADITLAEKKVALDQRLATWKRQSEIAEQALTKSYEARAALRLARLPVFGGKTRPGKEGESDPLKTLRDQYYAPVERLAESEPVFTTLRALRPAIEAQLGRPALEPINVILKIEVEIINAAATLIENAEKPSTDQAHLVTLGLVPRPRPDDIEQRIDEAISSIEAVCQPVLAWSGA
jgi:hypothetical protein